METKVEKGSKPYFEPNMEIVEIPCSVVTASCITENQGTWLGMEDPTA